jgi:GT2 family glycosyltransferase
LVATHQVFPSDLSFGPVLAEPEIGSISYRDKFKSKFDSLPDGALVKQAGAGNMLIPSYLLDSKLVSFDSFFNESGSEDTDLCFRLRKKGFKIRYSKGAEIFELQGRERVSAQYMKSRELKDVCNYSLVIRRNCGIFAISWRILTLSLRVLWFSALSLHSKNHKFQRTLFLKSLQALVRGRLD